MNWLAHLFLSEPSVEMRLGNLLADIVKGTERQKFNAQIQRGIQCHQIIDRFTDNHPIFICSRQRINPEYRRFAGVFVDVFYDHFLAKNWTKYTNTSLDEFTSEVYTSFQDYPREVPIIVRQLISRIEAEDWLGSYRHIQGVEDCLLRISKRLSRRLKKPFFLQQAVDELTNNYDEFEQDLCIFFPELYLHIKEMYCIR
ncbi:MAG: DUF479 domain-containing protein [Sphaerospermopsis sp. SIO1G1]|nr:DUF479 domain-containing protein [Sphaerospermopsis sp. SIO1G1]